MWRSPSCGCGGGGAAAVSLHWASAGGVGCNGKHIVANVGTHSDSEVSLPTRWSGMRIANVQMADRRLRFSIVVKLCMASWAVLIVIPKVNKPKKELLWSVR